MAVSVLTLAKLVASFVISWYSLSPNQVLNNAGPNMDQDYLTFWNTICNQRNLGLTLSQNNVDVLNIKFYNVRINLRTYFEIPIRQMRHSKTEAEWPISFRDEDVLLVIGQHRTIIWKNLVGLTRPMLHTKSQGHLPTGSGEENF